MKRCYSCGETKPYEEFKKNRSRYDGVSTACKVCSNIQDKKRYQTPAGKATNRRSQLKRRYGITSDEYNALLEAQGGACKICGILHTEENPLHVDHCHASLNVRGLLCRHCNHGLGNFKDDPDLLNAALDYLGA